MGTNSHECRFAEWLAVYRPLYGGLATRELFDEHLGRAAELVSNGAYAIPPFQLCLTGGSGPQKTMACSTCRKVLGEFYTPEWLVEFVLRKVGYDGRESVVDPSCGVGAFVAQTNGVGFDINPLSVMEASVSLGSRVWVGDVLFDSPTRYDFVVGNPPWVNWRAIAPEYRERTLHLWREYGLFEKKGLAARLGGGMDDLSALITYVCADRWLAENGRMGLVLPQQLFQSAGGGEGFRRMVLPAGRFLNVVDVHEIARQAFEGATTRAVVAVFEVTTTPQRYPVPYFRGEDRFEAKPIGDEPSSAWAILKNGDGELMAKLRGKSPYVARIGAHTGGAAGVYWVDVIERRKKTVVIRNRGDAGRNTYPTVEAEIESSLVRPLLRGRDVQRDQAQPSGYIVMPHGEDGKPIRDLPPKARAYFEQFRRQLLDRPHYRRHFESQGMPYWSMYNVGPYTFARHRVVWREQSQTFQSAAVEGDVIADAKLIVVPCESADEAQYLAAMLNSEPARTFVESYAVKVQISTHVLKYLNVPKFDPLDEQHRRADARAIWGLAT